MTSLSYAFPAENAAISARTSSTRQRAAHRLGHCGGRVGLDILPSIRHTHPRTDIIPMGGAGKHPTMWKRSVKTLIIKNVLMTSMALMLAVGGLWSVVDHADHAAAAPISITTSDL